MVYFLTHLHRDQHRGKRSRSIININKNVISFIFLINIIAIAPSSPTLTPSALRAINTVLLLITRTTNDDGDDGDDQRTDSADHVQYPSGLRAPAGG